MLTSASFNSPICFLNTAVSIFMVFLAQLSDSNTIFCLLTSPVSGHRFHLRHRWDAGGAASLLHVPQQDGLLRQLWRLRLLRGEEGIKER